MNKAEVSVQFNQLIRQVDDTRAALSQFSIDMLKHDTRLASELNQPAGLFNEAAAQIDRIFQAEMDRLNGTAKPFDSQWDRIDVSQLQPSELHALQTARMIADAKAHQECIICDKPSIWARIERWFLTRVFGGVKNADR